MSRSAARRSGLLGTAAAGLLLLAAATPAAAARRLVRAGSAGDATEPLVALVALAAWALTAWLLLTVTVTAGAHLPGRMGRMLGATSRRIAPAAIRRAVEVTLGLAVAVGGLGAAPAAATPATPATPHLDGAAPAPTSPGPDLDWAPTPATPGTLPGPVSRATAAAPTATAGPPATNGAVVVRTGDTLWGLAEQQLARTHDAAPTDAQVAQAWPAWWAANRDVVGDDPDLIHPGTRLTPPTGGSTPS